MQSDDRTTVQLSILSPVGYSSSSCGYCTPPGSGKRSSHNTSKSYGVRAHRLSPYHYQTLIDQGWRRSGDYIYKPDVLRTCCAQIPIRLRVDTFKPNKRHRRTLTNLLFRVRSSKPKPAKWKGKWSRGRDWDVEKRCDEILSPCDARQSAESAASSAWADEVAGPITHKMQVRLALASSSDEKYQLFRKYQAKVHGESQDEISTEEGFRRFLVDTSMTLTWPSSRQPLSPMQEAQWRNKSFDLTALPHELPYGNYHQEYRLDGKLIAVAVLDILPKCVSSVYVFYDPEYNDWQLGKVSALEEIALTKRLGRRTGMAEVACYYMGFYIHTCQKMKYKAEYGPSELLDCSTYRWYDLVDVVSKLHVKQAFGWSDAQQQSSQDNFTAQETMHASKDTQQDRMRLPTQPIPPPGMLDARAMVEALDQTLRGSKSSALGPALDALQRAMVLESQSQGEGIKPVFMSNIFRDHLQSRGEQDEENSELVQVVECVAALANAELVSQTVLFI